MIASDVISVVRTRLNDTTSGSYRFADSELLEALSMAEMELFAARPDCVTSDDDDSFHVLPPVQPTTTSDLLSTNERFKECLVHGTLAMVYGDDTDEHEANPEGKAAFHRARFELLKAKS